MAPLPQKLDSNRNVPGIAYNIILELERRIQHKIDSGNNMEEDMINCRILGYLFHHFPERAVNGDFVREITSINGNDEKLLKLGQQYRQFFVKLFKSNQGRTPSPSPSPHPSRPSFDRIIEQIKATLQEAPQNHQAAKKLALARDGYRCVVTKIYDTSSAEHNKELVEILVSEGAETGPTHCAHIIPESINANIASGSHKESYPVSVWAVLDRFGHQSIWEELNGDMIHRLENVMTMEPRIHALFDTLKVWFAETEEPNTYRLEATQTYLLNKRPKYVTFTTADPKLPPPSPKYLAIHAACARVAHFSGAAEYIEKVFRDMEDIDVLAQDGGSSGLLHEAILNAKPVAV
ncbi:hypothetical protein BKA82DRAFT_991374 [Pisolithus tinctorius]|uniref:HNH nuclease domain-containing protein n=1 Tax=Pisolithus tinctorius Marx 270 TaxID=870435 RepID=A0A0C3PK86_PISTI|nr:hypothetical protein BKA82DRAFT_991374 [Pisolithus tinctorius]KIO14625.1 hypothetical protein M404DRAFT_991374 [Pisolithus tinctorius Marx 270]